MVADIITDQSRHQCRSMQARPLQPEQQNDIEGTIGLIPSHLMETYVYRRVGHIEHALWREQRNLT